MITQADLWQTIFASKNLGVFWKDRDRRFLGVNDYFLRYYDLGLADVLGKTDEEMGWNEQVDRFKNIEEKVLEDGQSQITWGTTVARGQSRTIIAYKEPIYQDGEIVGLLGFFSDVSQQQDRLDELSKEARRDSLTMLKNRWALERANLTGQELTLMIADIDYFKRVNDTYGHQAGDEALKLVAQALKQEYGDQYCYRYGGDEFLVVGPIAEKDLQEKFQAVQADLKGSQLFGQAVPLSLSGGYVHAVPQNAQDLDAMLQRADQYLYQSKEQGRKRLTGEN
ncbi:sensor domain-containing diguanylate cyclase [Lactobacillus sp.]|uniref:sensor domain-containing diguanylate cyclase n=1 Tax=Lactobacillus sp. TaxID=1591 RepID=UPI003EF6420F